MFETARANGQLVYELALTRPLTQRGPTFDATEHACEAVPEAAAAFPASVPRKTTTKPVRARAANVAAMILDFPMTPP